MLPYDTYLHLMDELDRLVASFEAHADEETRDRALTLLNGIDLLHREGIQRLVAAVRERGGGALVDEATEADPVVRALLGLYDLAELDLPEEDGGDVEERNEAEAPPPGTAFVPLERLTVRGKPLRDGARGDPAG